MITIKTSDQDVTKFWLEQRNPKNPRFLTGQGKTMEMAIAELVRRECRRLYGTNKYKPNGERYSRKERPWIWPLF